MNNQKNIESIRHSLAHLLAHTVKKMYPGSINAIGPIIEDGFYQDFELSEKISEDDLQKIEDAMRQELKKWHQMDGRESNLEEIKEIFKDNKYKLELAEEFSEDSKTLTIYSAGDFVDLCKGGHCASPSKDINPDAFKLTRLAGAYWRGDSNNIMLTRIYGVAFNTKEELDQYLQNQELAKQNDHRKLGKEMDLFFISNDVGAGLPLLTPRGERIKKNLMDYMRQEEEKRGYSYVATPLLAQEDLYKRSGHADYYLENMYCTETDEDGNKFYIKPMNCPHHHMVFEHIVHSYKQLPIRLAEHAGLYRYELSGALTGLIRMRGPITQNDSHTYVTPEQLEEEFSDLIQFFNHVYSVFGMDNYQFRVSLPDFNKDKFGGDKNKWIDAADKIKSSLDKLKQNYTEVEGEAAFYGPKLDIQYLNVSGKEDTIATIQVDILVPERMNIVYDDKDGNKQNPIVIHKALLGSFERFMGFLLENTGGRLPFWLAPEQIRILTINDTVSEYVDKITSVLSGIVLMEPLKYNEIRFSVDSRNESLGKKIKEATELKTPILMIIGPKDVESGQVSIRTKDGESKINLDDLKEYIVKLK
jgi:threonyl-tRNA synthetase